MNLCAVSVAVLIFWFACLLVLFELCTVSKQRKGLTCDTDRFACQEALELNALNMKYMSLSTILIAFLLGVNQAHSPGWINSASHVQTRNSST